MSLGASAAIVQCLYEQGRLSYPRTSDVQMSGATSVSLTDYVSGMGVAVQANFSAHHVVGPAHEAVHPTEEGLAAAKPMVPPWMLDENGQALRAIVRYYVRAIAPAVIEVPKLNDTAPAWARALAWSRPCASTPSASRPSTPATLMYSHEVIAFVALCRAGLGRPSTLVEHAERAASRETFDEVGLTSRGRVALAAAPASLDAARARAIEQRLDAIYQSPRTRGIVDKDSKAAGEAGGSRSNAASPLKDAVVDVMRDMEPDMERALLRALARTRTNSETENVQSDSSVEAERIASEAAVNAARRMTEDNLRRAAQLRRLLASADQERRPPEVPQKVSDQPAGQPLRSAVCGAPKAF